MAHLPNTCRGRACCARCGRCFAGMGAWRPQTNYRIKQPRVQTCAASRLELATNASCTGVRTPLARRPGHLPCASPLHLPRSGAALRSAHARLTRPSSSPLHRSFVSLRLCTADSCTREPDRCQRRAGAKRALRAAPGRLKAGWDRPGGGPQSRRGQLWNRGRVTGATNDGCKRSGLVSPLCTHFDL